MSNILFPTLPGLHWEVKVKEEFSVLTQAAAAPGYETDVLLGPDPIFHWELDFDFLRQPGAPNYAGSAIATDEMQILRGFFRARQGRFDSFLLSLPLLTENPGDGYVAGQVLTPDANGVAPVVVTGAGGYTENIYELAGLNFNLGAAPVIYFDGAPLTAGVDYNIVGPGYVSELAGGNVTYPGLVIIFITSPSGHLVTASFTWYYRVRFEQSTLQLDKFLALLYSANQVQLVTTRTNNYFGDLVAINGVLIPGDAGDVVQINGAGIPYSPGDTIRFNGV